MKNKGITLIALVITVIVLLILAGISISMLSGDNSILSRVTQVKERTEESQIDEQEKLNNYATLVNGVAGGDLYGGEKEITQKIAENKTLSGGTVTPLSKTETTTLKDDYDNKVKVPKGFGIAEDSGTKVEEGIVIEDADNTRSTYGSQFVWVPVGIIYTNSSKTETKTITLGRYTFSSDGTVSLRQEASKTDYVTGVGIDSSYEYDATNTRYLNVKSKNLESFITSTIDNGGYYIARYEAGVKGTTASGSGVTYTIDGNTFTKDSTTENSIVIKLGVGVWNCITQPKAATVCQSMYNTDSAKITSDLINSYAWDTAIVFIQMCGIDSNSSNYSYTHGKSKSGSLKATGYNMLYDTNAKDVQCKIYDMAGNVREWSTETGTYIDDDDRSYPCIYRGGNYSNEWTTWAYERNQSKIINYASYVGFRPILYF